MNKNNTRIFLIMTLIGSGIIYQLPYLKNIFFIPMIESYDISYYEMGVLSAVYSTISVFSYFFGGFFAEKVAWKELLSAAFISTGIVGFFMSFATSYSMLLFCFAAFGVSTVLPYFSATMCINNALFLASDKKKLKSCAGIARGITSMLLGGWVVFCFIALGGKMHGLRMVILCYSVVSVIFGLWVLITFPSFTALQKSALSPSAPQFKKTLLILKKRSVQQWCLQIATAYGVYVFMGSCIPLLHLRYGLSSNTTLLLGILRYACSALSVAIAVGLERKKIAKLKIMRWGNVINMLCMMILLVLPATTHSILPIIILFLSLSICVYSCREFYFSLYSEKSFSTEQYGIAIGLVAFISYLPEILLQPLMGYYIDQQAFSVIFIGSIIFCMIGIITSRKMEEK